MLQEIQKFFLRYWNNEKGTKYKFAVNWTRSGDEGSMDEDGNFSFSGRMDDVITSSGYRIRPSEIEEQLLKKHPALGFAATIGRSDKLRGHIIKAFIRINSGFEKTEKMKTKIQDFVKSNLATHEYPRMIEFLDDLPLTTPGKVIRRVLRE